MSVCKYTTDDNRSPSLFKVVIKQISAYESDLQIIECNNFRQICHIQIRLKKADDEKLKKYLSEKLLAYKNKYEIKCSDLSQESSKLEEQTQMISELKQNLTTLDTKKEREVDIIRKDCDNSLLESKKSYMNQESKLIKERDSLITQIKDN